MKKFLSLVLALVLTMSLVVVPANAGTGEQTPSSSGETPQTVSVESVTLSDPPATLFVDGTTTLIATVAPENATDKTVTWTSSDETVATVTDGTVTAKKAGTATITAKAGEKSDTCTVTVQNKYRVDGIDPSYTLFLNGDAGDDTAVLNPSITPNAGYTGEETVTSYEYDPYDPNVVSVATTDGVTKVTAVGAGTTTITVTAKDSGGNALGSATTTITVKDRYTLEFTSSANTVKVGETLKLSAVLKDNKSGQPAPAAVAPTYTAPANAAASVSDTGVVTGLKMGDTVIGASLTHNTKTYTASCTVTVSAAPARLSAIRNGDYKTYTEADIAAAIRAATGAASNAVSNVRLTVPNSTWATIYPSGGSSAAPSGTPDITNGMTVYANRGRIGTMSCNLTATVDGISYNGTLEISITSAGSVSDTVYAYVTSSNSVSFELPSGYDTLYYKEGSVSSYDGLWSSTL